MEHIAVEYYSEIAKYSKIPKILLVFSTNQILIKYRYHNYISYYGRININDQLLYNKLIKNIKSPNLLYMKNGNMPQVAKKLMELEKNWSNKYGPPNVNNFVELPKNTTMLLNKMSNMGIKIVEILPEINYLNCGIIVPNNVEYLIIVWDPEKKAPSYLKIYENIEDGNYLELIGSIPDNVKYLIIIGDVVFCETFSFPKNIKKIVLAGKYYFSHTELTKLLDIKNNVKLYVSDSSFDLQFLLPKNIKMYDICFVRNDKKLKFLNL